MTCTRLRFYVVGLTLALLAPVHAGAQQAEVDPRYKNNEIAMLPAYCQSRMGLKPQDTERWVALMGESYDHIHHYCRGLIAINRSIGARTNQDRVFQLGVSINEFDYVIQHATKGFVLMPEILTKKGESLIRLGKGPQAAVELERAIQLKNDYWPPYAAMSDYYKGVGDVRKAREWLEKGLAAAPGTRALTRRLEELESAKNQRQSAPQPAKEPAEAKPPSKKG